MADDAVSIDTQHDDMIHDAQYDYYSKYLATCSSDKSVKIFDAESQNIIATLKGHEGPVWQISWAHPKFGCMLASCSYDRKVIIWKENSPGQWSSVFEYSEHDLSVNSVAWAPHQFGLCLACASSDTTISVLTNKEDGTWNIEKFIGHGIGVNSVSWSPPLEPSAILNANNPQVSFQKRLVSAGCDNLIKIWSFSAADNVWNCENQLSAHKDWVRDVAWCPNIGLKDSTIASCSQDGTVIVWNSSSNDGKAQWEPTLVTRNDQVVWRVSWSLTGNILAVAGGDNSVTLWKETNHREWKCIQSLDQKN